MPDESMQLPIFRVDLNGHDPLYVSADTRSQAKGAAYRALKKAYTEFSWNDFLALEPRATRCRENPHPDCYDTVKRQYGVDVEVGDRVTVQAGGWTARQMATVRYPGPWTAHVHVRFDGDTRDLKVHPTEVTPEPEPATAPKP